MLLYVSVCWLFLDERVCARVCVLNGHLKKKKNPPSTKKTNKILKISLNLSVLIDPAQISELLSKTIADAHSRTCLLTTEEIQQAFLLRSRSHDFSKVFYYKNMTHEQLWLECAQKLTTVIQQIIEFAKMVPGFMRLSQDDQIVLLKAGQC